MFAVGSDDVILRLQSLIDPYRHRFLADVQMQEATDLALRVRLCGGLFHAANRQHLPVQRAQLLRRVGVQQLRDAALALGRGGVGYYPNPGFVHVDVDPLPALAPPACSSSTEMSIMLMLMPACSGIA